MEKNFDDIFESIKLLHKKYNSEDYLNNLDNFNKIDRYRIINQINKIIHAFRKYKDQRFKVK